MQILSLLTPFEAISLLHEYSEFSLSQFSLSIDDFKWFLNNLSLSKMDVTF